MSSKDTKKQNPGRMIVALVLIIVILCGVLFVINQKQKEIDISKKQVTLKNVDLTGQPTLGDENAPVTIVEFADFKCPACKQFSNTQFDKIKSNYVDTGKANFVFINFPFLSQAFQLKDDDSKRASIYGEAVYAQNKDAFWDYYKAVFKNQGKESISWATDEVLTQLISEHVKDIDLETLKADVKKSEFEDKISIDQKLVTAGNVSGTPTLFVNGKKITNAFDYDEIANTIENEIGVTN